MPLQGPGKVWLRQEACEKSRGGTMVLQVRELATAGKRGRGSARSRRDEEDAKEVKAKGEKKEVRHFSARRTAWLVGLRRPCGHLRHFMKRLEDRRPEVLFVELKLEQATKDTSEAGR